MTQYTVVIAPNLAQLATDVDNALRNGFQPVGGVTAVPTGVGPGGQQTFEFMQAVGR